MSHVSEVIKELKRNWSSSQACNHKGEEIPFKLKCTLYERNNKTCNNSLEYLPISLQHFYEVTDGASLFEDVDFGQWGLKIYPLNALTKNTESFIHDRRDDFKIGDLIIGEFLGDSDLLLLRNNKQADDYGSLVIVSAIDSREDWYEAASDFKQFLETYVLYNGDKFWE